MGSAQIGVCIGMMNHDMPEEYEGPEEPEEGTSGDDSLEEPPAFFPREGHDVPDELGPGQMVEVSIDGIYRGDAGGQPSQFVVLQYEDRQLPIMIGPFEANAILVSLERDRPDRPMTHDLIKNIVDRLGATVARVAIDDLWNGVYYAKVHLHTGTEEVEIDARPSDAIAIAVRFDAPIFVNTNVFESALAED